jgi:hypothetical protein
MFESELEKEPVYVSLPLMMHSMDAPQGKDLHHLVG